MKIYEKYSTRFNEIKHNILIIEKKINKLNDLKKDYIKFLDKEDIVIIHNEINKWEENKQKYVDSEIEYFAFIKNLEELKEVLEERDLHIGIFIKKPIERLVDFHQTNLVS